MPDVPDRLEATRSAEPGERRMRVDADRSSGAPPSLTVGPTSVGVVGTVSLAVALMCWFAPLIPVKRDYNWQRIRDALAVEQPRTLPSWWTSALFLAVVVAALAAWGTARGSGRPLRAPAWLVAAACFAWMSMDHAVGIHSHLFYFTRDSLPGVLGRHPVEVALLVVLTPVGAVLLAGSTPGQAAALAAGAGSYLVGAVVVNFKLVSLPLSGHHGRVVEASFEWLGLCLVALAASLERRE